MIRFADVTIDADGHEVRRAGAQVDVQPQVLDVLLYLIRHRGRVVPKEELLDEVWRTRFVTESALTSRIKSARQAIGDSGREQRMIRTVHGRGYRFVAPLDEDDDPAGAAVGGAADRAADGAAEPPPGARLPVPATPFVGRSAEVAEVARLLAGRAAT